MTSFYVVLAGNGLLLNMLDLQYSTDDITGLLYCTMLVVNGPVAADRRRARGKTVRRMLLGEVSSSAT